MTCIEAQAMITPFINNRLNMAQVERFFEHVKNCGNCQEELEVYYVLLTAMQQLDNDKDLSNDYAEELEQKIIRWEERIRYRRVLKFWRRFLLLFMIIGVGILFGVELGERMATEIEKNVPVHLEPSFKLSYSGIPEYKDDVQEFIELHDAGAREYASKKRERIKKIQQQMYWDWNHNIERWDFGHE